MAFQVQVENIKCGGCANSIRKQLQAVSGVQTVDVDVEQGLVSAVFSDQYEGDDLCALVLTELAKMGYPESGSVAGLKAAGAKAKSFVSCAVGRMSDDS